MERVREGGRLSRLVCTGHTHVVFEIDEGNDHLGTSRRIGRGRSRERFEVRQQQRFEVRQQQQQQQRCEDLQKCTLKGGTSTPIRITQHAQ